MRGRRVVKDEYGTRVWLSKDFTSMWANRPGERWPCSEVAGNSVFAAFDTKGNLVECAVNNGRGAQEISLDEFNALMDDVINKGYGA